MCRYVRRLPIFGCVRKISKIFCLLLKILRIFREFSETIVETMYKYDVYEKPIVVYEKHRVMYEKHRAMYGKKHCYIVLKIVICLIKLFDFSKICLICFDVYGKEKKT